MDYFYRSLGFLVVWMLLQIGAVYIHQDMRIAGTGGDRGITGGGGTDPEAPPTTTTAPLECSEPSDKGYALYNNAKWLKKIGVNMNFTSCERECKVDGARMLTLKSDADVASFRAMPQKGAGTWMGLKQVSNMTYEWSDKTTMTVLFYPHNGTTDVEGQLVNFWGYDSGWDKNTNPETDGKTCMFYSFGGLQGFMDEDCSLGNDCVCECEN